MKQKVRSIALVLTLIIVIKSPAFGNENTVFIQDDRSEGRLIPFHEPARPNAITDTIKKHSAENKEVLTAVAPKQVPERLSMDLGWKFSLGHTTDIDKNFDYLCGDLAINAKTGDPARPPNPGFDDRDWQHIDLPHDWLVGLEYDSLVEPLYAYKKIGRKYPENCIASIAFVT